MPGKSYAFDGNNTWLGVGVADIGVIIDTGSIPAFGTYVPTLSNVGLYGSINGVSANTSLTVNTAAIPAINGSSDPGNPLVIQNTRFKGVPNCASGYILFQHCDFFFQPQSATSARPCFLATNSAANVVVQDSDIHADFSNPNWQSDGYPNGVTVGIACTNTTIERCRIWDCSDGVNPTKGNVAVRGCWIGKQLYISPDPLRNGQEMPWQPNHADCIQIADGSNYTIEYNTLEAFNDLDLGQANVYDNNAAGSCLGYVSGGYSMANSGITLNLKTNMSGIVIRGNHIRGGRSGINMVCTDSNGTAALPNDGEVVLDTNYYDRTAFNNQSLIVPNAWGNLVKGIATEKYEDDNSQVVPKRY